MPLQAPLLQPTGLAAVPLAAELSPELQVGQGMGREDPLTTHSTRQHKT